MRPDLVLMFNSLWRLGNFVIMCQVRCRPHGHWRRLADVALLMSNQWRIDELMMDWWPMTYFWRMMNWRTMTRWWWNDDYGRFYGQWQIGYELMTNGELATNEELITKDGLMTKEEWMTKWWLIRIWWPMTNRWPMTNWRSMMNWWRIKDQWHIDD